MEKIWLKSWPEGIPQSLEFPEKPLPEFLRENARRKPNKTAINFYGREISFQELNTRTDQLAAALIDLGLKKGDRVSLFLENSPQFVIGYFAILRAGGVVVAANPMFKEEELAYEVRDAGAKILIAQDILLPKARDIRAEASLSHMILTSYSDFLPTQPRLPLHPSMLAPKLRFPESFDLLELMDRYALEPVRVDLNPKEDLALLQYTSGTTGLPKGAMISHYSLLFNTVGSVTWQAVQETDVVLSVLPFFHVTGMIHSMNNPVYTGTTNVMLSRFDAETALKAIHEFRCTSWTSITTMNVAVVNFPDVEKYDLSSLKRSLTGGAPVPGEILEKWRKKVGTELSEGYGLSETISQTHMNPVHTPRYGTIGLPTFDLECRIVDLETGNDLPPGEEGELVLKGPTVMKGYWNRPEETREALRDGWLYTGDLARVDEDGYFYIVGRKKDLIKASGFSVFPAEVENFLYGHTAVKEVAVVGVPDPYRGENIKAFIVLKPEYQNQVQAEEIIAWCREKMAAYKYPRIVEFVEELPKTASGKVLKRVLREREIALSQQRAP
jgi:acyl-CoA synthetase (AMP-forming)/AMP-acid ligase II